MKPVCDKKTTEQLEKEYLSKILGFCYQKVNCRNDAEDLASEIMLEIVSSIYRGKKIENLNAFVWRVSNHIFCKWLRSKRRGTTAYLDEMFVSPDNTEREYILKEQNNILRREIALLSENYRKAIVLYYFEDKSCDEIAQILGKSNGTVKWWLHGARKSIKKGFDTMREYGEKSYNPGTLFMSCQGFPGGDNEPMSCAKRKLPQNILLAAYNESLTAEELCIELGTPAPYIEDEVHALVKQQLMKEVSKGKYQTDFVILPGQNAETAHNLYRTCFPGYYNVLMDFLETHKACLTGADYNTAGFAWNRLLWVYIHIITDIALSKFRCEVCKTVSCQDMPTRPNGGKWIALGFNSGYFFEKNETLCEWKEYVPFDGPVHKTNKEFAQGFFHYWSGLDSSVFFDIPDGVFSLCRKIIKNEISTDDMDDEQKYLFSIAVEKKLFIKKDAGFQQNYYFVERSIWEKIQHISYELYDKVKIYFDKAYAQILDEYERTVPKHLYWQMGNFLSNHLAGFVTCSLFEGMKNGILSEPDGDNKAWLSLFVSEL